MIELIYLSDDVCEKSLFDLVEVLGTPARTCMHTHTHQYPPQIPVKNNLYSVFKILKLLCERHALRHKNWHMIRWLNIQKMDYDTNLHTRVGWCQPEFPALLLLCVGFLLRLQLNSICHSEEKSDCETGWWGAGGWESYTWRAKYQKHTSTHSSVSTSKGEFTDTRARARQRGDLNVILSIINLMYHIVHTFSISYFRCIIVDDMYT